MVCVPDTSKISPLRDIAGAILYATLQLSSAVHNPALHVASAILHAELQPARSILHPLLQLASAVSNAALQLSVPILHALLKLTGAVGNALLELAVAILHTLLNLASAVGDAAPEIVLISARQIVEEPTAAIRQSRNNVRPLVLKRPRQRIFHLPKLRHRRRAIQFLCLVRQFKLALLGRR